VSGDDPAMTTVDPTPPVSPPPAPTSPADPTSPTPARRPAPTLRRITDQLHRSHQPDADALVLFGATGDLDKRKLFPALYHLERRGQLTVPVIGVARSDWTDADFQARAVESIEAAVDDPDPAVIARLRDRLDLIQGDYSDRATWQSLADTLDRHGSHVAVYYMAIPPTMFPRVAESLRSVGLQDRGRIVVEKPFGRDLSSAQELNDTLHSIFPEERIFRIDHYLGKEAVEDLLVFRFSNMLLDPIWNRRYVRSVQVTMAESIGVEGRGSFYDSVGAIRDVFQNHLLQVVALLAMEPPVGADASFLQDEKAKVLAAMTPIDPRELIRGQYEGYRDEPGVAEGSTVETFAAATLYIESWRWAGVPWHVRVGKGLAANVTEAVIELSEPPQLLFDEAGGPPPGRNLVRFRLGKDDGVTFALQAKTPGPHLDSQEVDVKVDFAAALGERQEAYERLLHDALDGSARRFAREDVVERTWRVVQPALDEPGPVHPYPRGSWGPAEAGRACGGDVWFEPSD
jgi:glucose-6-phosphate 1-dehydrogenase